MNNTPANAKPSGNASPNAAATRMNSADSLTLRALLPMVFGPPNGNGDGNQAQLPQGSMLGATSSLDAWSDDEEFEDLLDALNGPKPKKEDGNHPGQ